MTSHSDLSGAPAEPSEESIKRGIEDARAGRVHDLGSFAKYAEESAEPSRQELIDLLLAGWENTVALIVRWKEDGNPSMANVIEHAQAQADAIWNARWSLLSSLSALAPSLPPEPSPEPGKGWREKMRAGIHRWANEGPLPVRLALDKVFEFHPKPDTIESLVDFSAAVYALCDAVASSPSRPPEPDAGCPCTLIRPCSSQCTCAHPLRSGGCDRCAKYGSRDQRMAKAKALAAPVPVSTEGTGAEEIATCRAMLEAYRLQMGGGALEEMFMDTVDDLCKAFRAATPAGSPVGRCSTSRDGLHDHRRGVMMVCVHCGHVVAPAVSSVSGSSMAARAADVEEATS